MNHDDESVIRQGQPGGRVTVSGDATTHHDRAVIMPTAALDRRIPDTTGPITSTVMEIVVPPNYPADMTVSAHDVAAVLRERIPGLTPLKLHKLLYYVQAHHLAAVDKPLFAEAVSAWDMGPVVGELWKAEDRGEPAPPRRQLTSGHLNIIDYVISRYGSLHGIDLMHMTHAEDPWKTADEGRSQGDSARIRNEWMRDYFRDEPHDEGEIWFTQEKVAELTAGAEERRRRMGPPDLSQAGRLDAFFDEIIGQPRAG